MMLPACWIASTAVLPLNASRAKPALKGWTGDGPRYGLGIQGIEYDHSLAGRDDPAVQIAGAEHVMAGNDLAYAAGLAALRLLGVRRSATQEHDSQSYG